MKELRVIIVALLSNPSFKDLVPPLESTKDICEYLGQPVIQDPTTSETIEIQQKYIARYLTELVAEIDSEIRDTFLETV